MRNAAGSIGFAAIILVGPAVWAQTPAALARPSARPADPCPPKPRTAAAAKKQAGFWYVKGIKEFKAGRFKEALSSFECTQKIMPAKLTEYWIARSCEATGHLRRALEIYKDLLVEPPEPVKPDELRWRISSLKDQLRAYKPPRPEPEPRPPKKPDKGPRRTIPLKERPLGVAAWTTWAAAGALVVAGAALAVVTWQNGRALSGASDGTWWEPDLKRRYDRHDSLVAGTWTCFSLGIAAAAAGAVLFVFDHRSKERPARVSFAPAPGGGYIGYTVRY